MRHHLKRLLELRILFVFVLIFDFSSHKGQNICPSLVKVVMCKDDFDWIFS